MTQETKSKIDQTICNQLCVDKSQLKPETTFAELGADSLDGLDLLMDLEQKFDVEVSDEQSESIKTVGDIYKLADELLK